MNTDSEQFEILFTVDKVDPIVLYGIGDQFLKLIERHFPVQLIARGDQLKIRGPQEEANQVENILSELTFIANKNGQLIREDIETLIHIVKSDVVGSAPEGSSERENAANELDEVVLFTKNGYVKPRTKGQHRIVQASRKNDLVVVVGPAGTGKTYMTVALAVAALKEKRVKKIVLARPAVEAGESLGFLPGDFKEKIDPYLRPLYDAIGDMMPREMVKKYMEQGIIEVIPLAYMRGRTINNSFVILDESQNATSMQMKMFLTRLGVNSKAIVTGDATQIDLPPRMVSGLIEILDILRNIDGIEFIHLDRADVVRHRLVRDIILAYDEHNKNTSGEDE
ncbi:MAG: PhoH family protein [Calditrichia bacterium]